jgi:8-oxo-dGTP pyrophosphatase MutT (NUDIX family)
MSTTAALPPPSTSTLRVRQRAAALITQRGRVLLHQLEGDRFWALPGGAIEPGESASEALARELREELGEAQGGAVTVGTLAVVAENFFAYGGVSYHEIGLYLQAHPVPGSPLATADGPYDGVEGDRKLVFAWFSPDQLASLDVRPAFLTTFFANFAGQEPTGVLHIVHRDAPLPAHDPAFPLATGASR